MTNESGVISISCAVLAPVWRVGLPSAHLKKLQVLEEHEKNSRPLLAFSLWLVLDVAVRLHLHSGVGRAVDEVVVEGDGFLAGGSWMESLIDPVNAEYERFCWGLGAVHVEGSK